MTSHSRNLVLLAAAVAILPAAAARAQSYGPSYAQPAPLYPYAAQQSQPYAIQVAPNTYLIQRSAQTRDYPYVNCGNCDNRAATRASKRAAPRVIEGHTVVDERARAKCKRGLIENCESGSRARGDETKKRVIDAEAEITILGPDRMTIRLFRKRGGPDAKALIDE